jgi:phosphohistidine phosphatase
MELFIVRHAEAGTAIVPRGHADAERELTAEGRKVTAAVAKSLRALRCRPDRIGTSPLARARQTAEVLAEVLDAKKKLEICGFLSPGAHAEALVGWLRDARQDSAIMIVGHMPDLTQLASALLTENARLDIAFKKSGVCCISFDGAPALGAGRLEWLLQPKQLRGLARAKKRS